MRIDRSRNSKDRENRERGKYIYYHLSIYFLWSSCHRVFMSSSFRLSCTGITYTFTYIDSVSIVQYLCGSMYYLSSTDLRTYTSSIHTIPGLRRAIVCICCEEDLPLYTYHRCTLYTGTPTHCDRTESLLHRQCLCSSSPPSSPPRPAPPIHPPVTSRCWLLRIHHSDLVFRATTGVSRARFSTLADGGSVCVCVCRIR